MRKAIALSIAAALLLVPATVLAQDEAPAVTVVPDSQFCNLVADDLATCEDALQTLASAGMLPESFAGLMSAPAQAGGDEPATAGEPVVITGKGSKRTKPFSLAEGEYEVTLKTGKGCDDFTYASLRTTEDRSAGQGLIEQDGYVYGMEEGRYFWDATADKGCKWTYTLTPLE